jgi:hypothetical protein
MNDRARIIVGGLLVGGGLLFLLDNLGLFTIGPLLWGALLALAAAGFLVVFLGNRQHWWALIPGMTLAGIAAIIFLGELAPGIAEVLSGVLILGSISLSFWVIYGMDRQNWWAVIPGGTLATLALITVISERWGGELIGGLLFLGLGLTFLLVYLLPTPHGRMTWAIFPAGGLLLTGVIVSASTTSLLNFVWPLALILGGLFLILRNRRTV